MKNLTSIALAWIALAGPLAAQTEYHFDFGPPDSPVAAGFTGVHAGVTYSPGKRYGWSAGMPVDYTAPKPALNRRRWYHFDPHFFYDEMASDLRMDGVESDGSLSFKVDVPAGRYRVIVTAGHLNEARYGIDITANGKLVAKKVDARHWLSSERGRLHNASGYYKRVRFSVDVGGAGLTLDFSGDDAEYRRLLEIEKAKSPDQWPKSRFRKDSLPAEHLPFYDIGGPFTKVSLMGVEVYPEKEMPLRMDGASLKLSAAGAAAGNQALQKAIAAFNSGEFKKAELDFLALSDPLLTGIGLLALAGRPDYENELENAGAAVAALKKAVASGNAGPNVKELLDSAEIFLNGLLHFRDRAVPPNNGLRSTWRAIAEFDQIQPDDWMYYKSLVLQARYMIMLDPHHWAWHAQEGKSKLRVVEARFPQNRFVRFHLHGDVMDWPDWKSPDYQARTKGAPTWAANVHAAYNREVDLAEWWIKNRQQSDGSLGGGWGDDVEILRVFGAFVGICPDASPLVMEGVRKVADGAWLSGGIDTEAGYFAEVGDTEHTGEWTADTLVAMIRTDYGNPLYIERALRTGKLMRDLWMDRNEKGHYLMRSNFLGATGVGGDGTENDSSINYRPASPARAVLWYNNLPALKQMFLDWADAWLAAAMSTEKGKPRGILPEEIGFARSEIGGTNAPAWYRAEHRPGTVNSDWQGSAGYHDHTVDLLVFAHKATGQVKYLEPMKLEADFVERHCPKEILASEEAKQGRVTANLWKDLAEGSKEWIAARLAAWPKKWDAMRRVLFPEQFPEQAQLTTLDEVEEQTRNEIESAAREWPLVTSECIATDRVHWLGMGNAFKIMTGYGVSGQVPAVTYRGFGRDFAAAVLKVDAANLKAIVYSVSAEPKEAAIVPWILDLGARYDLKAGPDNDGDGRMDHAAEQRAVLLQHRGQGVLLRFPGRTSYVVELKKLADHKSQELYPDLGLSQEDIQFVPEYRRVDVTVHNIGGAAARNVMVVLSDGEKEVGRQRIPNIEAPLDLDAKWVRIGFPFTPSRDRHEFTAILDPDGLVEEINESNNKAVAARSTPRSRSSGTQVPE